MEAAIMVGGAVLAPLFEALLADLRSGDLLNYARKKGVRKELRKWKDTLETIKEVLEKAEEQQRTENRVKRWYNDLQSLAYDVKDILDEFNTKAKVESKAGTSRVRKMIRSSIDWFALVSTAEIKNISERLKKIKESMELLKLGENEGKSPVKDDGTTKLTSPLVNEAHVYGREEDRKRILNQLNVESGDGKTPVIPIVGMGGLGKTTLAQLVYKDATLQFDFNAWVTVGESFDVPTITKAILEQLTGDQVKDFSSLHVKLKEKLSGKKALVVLDDVWLTVEEYEKWTLFYSPFGAGTQGSKIIVTTRNQSVSRITSAADGYALSGLSSDDCLSILANHALERTDFNEHPDLKELGGQIAKKCDGLPLAAKALGGILRGKQDTSSWEGVLNSKIWEEGKSVLQALWLSYYHLPSHLKRCFSYTAIFPKHYEFDKTRLVSLWMAEGFVQEISEGFKYFDELLARSFFQKSSSDESLYVMHDLMNDLAKSVSGSICFNLDEDAKVDKPYAKVRHVAFTCCEYEIAPRFEMLHEMRHLRTFLALKRQLKVGNQICYLSPTMLDLLIKKLKCLRVLVLPYTMSELPDSIDCLKHLRCLDLSYSKIEMLPESLCDLFNLKVLILFRCENLRELPKGFCNLINLQCLDIRGTDKLEEMPLPIGELQNLHIIGKFVVGKSDGPRMLELLKIPNLQGRQHISALQNVINVQDVECWKMRQLDGVDGLTLEWSNIFDNCRNEKNEQDVLSALKPQKNIMELSIESYGGRELPSWIGDPSFGKMKILKLRNCNNVVSLPALGQLPSLEELTLQGMKGVKEVGSAFYGNASSSTHVFPSLKILTIYNMEELYGLSNYSIAECRGQVFPKLKKLELKNCPKLEIFDCSFPNLDKLVVENCKEVVLRSISNLQSLTKLDISRISGIESFNGAFLEALVSLQEMYVNSCGELKHLWDDEFNVDRLGCLKKLEIEYCEELVSLVEEDEGNFPTNLQYLAIYKCNKLEKLPNQLHSLTYLWVKGCPQLETFLTRALPYGVKHVYITNCGSLVSLPSVIDNSNSGQMSQVEKLTIGGCNAESNDFFPSSPRSLTHLISGAVEAQLFRALQVQNGLSHLISLRIENCRNLKSFPLPIPTLLFLSLYGCENLRSLPNHMNQFTSLQTLEMYDCPEVVSFQKEACPQT